jgi:hypothetical protein
MGFVYLIENTIGKESRYKIGHTKNINKRIKQLQTGNPGIILEIDSYESKYYTLIENNLHKYFSSKNVIGEWFILEKNDINLFRKKCELIEKNLECLKDNYFFNKKYKL